MKLSDFVMDILIEGPRTSAQITSVMTRNNPDWLLSQRSVVMALGYLEAQGKVFRSRSNRGAAAIWSRK